MAIFPLILAALAGLALAVQAAVNARLREGVGDPYWATAIQSIVGLLALGAALVVVRPAVSVAAIARAPWWAMVGGPLGVVFLLLSVVLLPRLGVTLLLAGVIVGQLLGGLLLDHYGWLGVSVQPVSIWRLAGVVLLVAGATLIRAN